MGSLCHMGAFLLKMANNLFLPSAIILACLVFAVSVQSSDAGEGSGQGAGASVNVNACREREAYSPENIKAFPICCLRPNFMENSIAQGGSRNFRQTRSVCCVLWKGQSRAVDALKTIGCTLAAQSSGAGPTIDVRACKEMEAYSPENIVANPICCLHPNFKETRDVCCELFKGQSRGVDALQTIGCNK